MSLDNIYGNIIVTQEGNHYVFAVQIDLASGLTSSQIYNGTMAYSDSY